MEALAARPTNLTKARARFTNLSSNAMQQGILLCCVKGRELNCAVVTNIRCSSTLFLRRCIQCSRVPTQAPLHHVTGRIGFVQEGWPSCTATILRGILKITFFSSLHLFRGGAPFWCKLRFTNLSKPGFVSESMGGCMGTPMLHPLNAPTTQCKAT